MLNLLLYGGCLTQHPVSSYAGVLSSLSALPHRVGVAGGAERIRLTEATQGATGAVFGI